MYNFLHLYFANIKIQKSFVHLNNLAKIACKPRDVFGVLLRFIIIVITIVYEKYFALLYKIIIDFFLGF